MTVLELTNIFPFSDIYLEEPLHINKKSLSCKLKLNKKPIYIRFPLCKIKNNIVERKHVKYCDLVFSIEDNNEFLIYIQKLEDICKEKIVEKSKEWFTEEINREEIDILMHSLYKYNINLKQLVIRCYIDKSINGNDLCLIYDEDNNPLTFQDIKKDTDILPILKIDMIKCNSNTFQIDVKLCQIMVTENMNYIENENENENNNENKNENENKKEEIENKEKIENIKDNKYLVKTIDIDNKDDTNQISGLNHKIYIDNNNIKNDSDNNNDNDNNSCNDLVDILKEVDIINELKKNEKENDNDMIHLKNPNELYYEIYEKALHKARELERQTIEAYLEAKNIKHKYMLDDIDDIDDIDSNLSKDSETNESYVSIDE